MVEQLYSAMAGMSVPLWAWFAVSGLLLGLLAIDAATNRVNPRPTRRRALVASAAWIGVSIAFGVVLGTVQDSAVAEQYFAGYLLEKALSIDNLFVFVLLFRALSVPLSSQHRVLYYGVVGALVLRAGFIAGGAALLDQFSWILYGFGALLLVAGARMFKSDTHVDPQRNLVVRGVRRVLPVTPDYVGQRFFARIDGRHVATPLFVALIVIEVTDLVFAVDSIPAIFGVTRDVFVVFTSNAFAILGMRALYFVLADAMDRFAYLKYGLAALLVFIGVKMFITPIVHISIVASLAVIAVAVGASVTASVWRTRRRPADVEANSGPGAGGD